MNFRKLIRIIRRIILIYYMQVSTFIHYAYYKYFQLNKHHNQMTRQLFSYLFVALTAGLLFSSCRDGEQGDPGPAGVGYYKTDNGELSGTIHYKYPNGDTAIIPFSNKGYISATESSLYIDSSSSYNGDDYYSFNIIRVNPNEENSSIRFLCSYAYMNINDDTCFLEPYSIGMSITNVTNVNNSLFAFATTEDIYNDCDIDYYSSGYDVTISNYYLNPVTHRLTFDYEFVVNYYNLESIYRYDYSTYPNIKGKVDVILNVTTKAMSGC
ncbi:MAG: hypothetical protein U0U66_13215 [Cytophagaceae bacterium]